MHNTAHEARLCRRAGASAVECCGTAGALVAALGLVLVLISGTVQAAPNSATPEIARKGGAAFVRGDTGEAITLYTKALADTSLANDRRAMILNDRAVAYARIGKTKEAFDDFNSAVQLFPEYAALYNNRGNLLLALGLVKEAVKDFDRALVLAPGYAAAYNNRAGARMRAGQVGGAIRDYTHAIRLLPSSAAPLSGRGLAHLQLDHPHAAIRDFSRAVGSDASFAAGYGNRAEAKLAVGHYEEGIEDLSRAVAFDNKNADMYRMRGRAYLVTGDAAAAIKDFSQAIELKPDDPALYAQRGLAHGRLGQFEEALADLGHAIERDPRSAVAFAYRGYVFKEQGQADVGMKDIARAVKLSPDNVDVLWAKAELEDALGQRDQAIVDLKRVLNREPGMKLAADTLERIDEGSSESEDVPVPGLGYDDWQVVARGKRFFAVNANYPRLSVPLEMVGVGSPKLISWQTRPSPLRHIGILTFSGGTLKDETGEEETEFAAILNTSTNTVVAIEPQRQGSKVSTWTWSDDKVTISAVDGVTDEFQLEPRRQPVASSSHRRRYSETSDYPWADPWAGSRSGGRRSGRPARRKPKTLFELLFN